MIQIHDSLRCNQSFLPLLKHKTIMSCSSAEVTLSSIFVAMTMIIVIICCYIVRKFTQNMEQENLSRLGKIFALCLHILTICPLVLLSFNESTCLFGYHEDDPNTSDINKLIFDLIKSTFLITYGMQTWLVLIIFFDRVRLVFKNTPLRLHKFTVYLWKILFILPPFYVSTIMILWITNNVSEGLWRISIGAAYLFAIVYMIALVILFINKLIQVYKIDHSKDENLSLISSITKIVILTTYYVLLTVIQSVWYQIKRMKIEDDNYRMYDWIGAYILILDIFMNYICIVLCFRSFKMNYIKLCKWMDLMCRKCWIVIIPRANDAVTMKMMEIVVNDFDLKKVNSNSTTPNTSTAISAESPPESPPDSPDVSYKE